MKQRNQKLPENHDTSPRGSTSANDTVKSDKDTKKKLQHIPASQVPPSGRKPSTSAATRNKVQNLSQSENQGVRIISPGVVPVPEEFHTDQRPWDVDDVTSIDNATIAVNAEPVPNEDDNVRLALENAQLQEQLRLQNSQPVVRAVRVDGNENKTEYGSVSSSANSRRGILMLFGLLLIGGVVAVVVVLMSSSSSSPTSPSSGGDTVGAGLTVAPSDGKEPTVPPTLQPTKTPAPTSTAAPTLTRRSFLLESLLPTLEPGSFSSVHEWDEHLIARAQSPQTLAIEWLSEQDEYSAWPASMATQELHERYALVVFYYSTKGADWSLFGSSYFLNSASSVCEWNMGTEKSGVEGVYCNNTATPGLVSFIDLSICSLEGTIPSEISLLQHLESLYLTENSLSGVLPWQLGSLSNLKHLWLEQNLLSGSIPAIMPPSLLELSLRDTYIAGTLATEWASSMPDLVSFYGDETWLQGTIPPEWGNFQYLQYLDLSDGYISGSFPTTMGLMTSMRRCYFYNNLMTGTLPAELAAWENLESLRIHSNPELGGTIPTEWGKLQKLSYLYMRDNSHSGTIPTEIGGMSSLVGLYLDGNQLSGPLPSEIANLSQLRWFDVQDNLQLTGTVPQEFGNWSNLSSFFLQNTSLTGSLDSVFCNVNEDPPTLYADCLGETPEIECSCCSYCCSADVCEIMTK